MKTSPFFLIGLCTAVQAQDSLFTSSDITEKQDNFRMMFYNVENFFDWMDDSLTNDNSFTPEGSNHWTEWRFKAKEKKLAQVIAAAGGWEPPAVIGLCEIENRFVLEHLTSYTILSTANYNIVHENSADSRGIDVALLYLPEKFDVRHYEYFRIQFPEADARPTRDILYVKGITNLTDTVHIFVNHWPSRYGGHLATDPKRMQAALTLRSKVDSIFTVIPNANIVITGDFNDHPEDASILEGLKAKHDTTIMDPGTLINLMYHRRHKEGTHKFSGEWGVLDMWIVSEALIHGKSGLKTSEQQAIIFKPAFLLEEENVHLGHRPFRTFQGPAYKGGYSDHLPIIIDLINTE